MKDKPLSHICRTEGAYHPHQWMYWNRICTQVHSLKPTSQYNVNRAVTAQFLPDLQFCTSVGRRPIFMTLNRSDNWVSDLLPITGGQPVRWPAGVSRKWPFFPGSVLRPPPGLLPMTAGSPADLWPMSTIRLIAGGSPSGDLPATGRWSRNDRQLPPQIWAPRPCSHLSLLQ